MPPFVSAEIIDAFHEEAKTLKTALFSLAKAAVVSQLQAALS
ncbi:MAG TPA: hypothetical protein VFV38_51195 [Ktedonobacteraceae bacterium]|nr:hypothetical protein [Ktedonobacteraceae bacterium]